MLDFIIGWHWFGLVLLLLVIGFFVLKAVVEFFQGE